MSIFRIKRFSTYSSSISEVSESSTINGKTVGYHEKVDSKKLPGKPRMTKVRKEIILPKRFSQDNRESASPSLLEKAKQKGVVQKVGDSWRIVSIKKKKIWDAHYDSRKNAESALRAYQANR